jgi:hypothetical protein
MLNANGITNDPANTVNQVQPGTPYSYTIEARFNGTHASGKRIELRPCTVSLAKI